MACAQAHASNCTDPEHLVVFLKAAQSHALLLTSAGAKCVCVCVRVRVLNFYFAYLSLRHRTIFYIGTLLLLMACVCVCTRACVHTCAGVSMCVWV